MTSFVMDANQLQALGQGPFLMVRGGPCTGKTFIIVERVVQLLYRGVHPDQIAVLAARDESAEALRRRLTAHPQVGSPTNNLFVGTVTQAANHILRSGGARAIGLDPDYSIWDEETACGDVGGCLAGAQRGEGEAVGAAGRPPPALADPE